jgi:hypothetical protein
MRKLKQALDELCDCEYPASIDDIKSDCENVTVEFQDGSETTLGRCLSFLMTHQRDLSQVTTSAVR